MKEVSDRTKSIAKKGCCLLSLLLLAVLVLPVGKVNLVQVKQVKTQVVLKDLTHGISGFRTEYNLYPLGNPTMQDDLKLESSGDLLRILMGEALGEFNPRKITYIEPPPAKDGKLGLTDDNRVLDAWGNPYIIMLDTNHDGRLTNPDFKNTDPEIRKDAPAELPFGVIVYSRGEDGIEGTKDDVVSWR